MVDLIDERDFIGPLYQVPEPEDVDERDDTMGAVGRAGRGGGGGHPYPVGRMARSVKSAMATSAPSN